MPNPAICGNKVKHKATAPYEVLWSDLAGPLKIPTRNGEKYVLGILDEYSRWVWVFLLKTKDEATQQFDKFLTRHTAVKHLIRVVSTDKGGEYQTQFNLMLGRHQIQHWETAANCPAARGSSLPVHKILNAFDVFILTSISEGTPTVIIEALACGKPVIAPNVGSIKEMLEGNPFCLVYDTLDSNAVHTQILKITDAPKAEVVQTCVEHFNRLFSYDTCVNAHIEAFK